MTFPRHGNTIKNITFFPMNPVQPLPLHLRADERGFALNLFSEIQAESGEIREFHVCSLNEGAVRGNHYHENAEEHILVLGGEALLALKNPEETDKAERRIRSIELVKINRNTAHAIKNEGQTPLHILCFYVSKEPVDIKTVRHPVL